MVKFIDNWLFATHIWCDAEPSPIAIHVRQIAYIDERDDNKLGKHTVIITQNNDQIPIEGNIIDVLAELQKYLQR